MDAEVLDSGFWGGKAASHNWEAILKELWKRRVRRVKVFMSEYLPEIEGTGCKIFPRVTWQLCMVRAVRDALSKARKDDREGTFQDLLIRRAQKGGLEGPGGVQSKIGQ